MPDVYAKKVSEIQFRKIDFCSQFDSRVLSGSLTENNLEKMDLTDLFSWRNYLIVLLDF